MKNPVHLVPQEFTDLYQLRDKIKNGFVYFKIICGMYGLVEAGVLANKLMKERLKITTMLNSTTLLAFSSIYLNQFGSPLKWMILVSITLASTMPYTWSPSLNPTMIWRQTGQGVCTMASDWSGTRSKDMLTCICPRMSRKKLIEYEYIPPKQPHYCPHQPDPIKYGTNSDKITPEVNLHVSTRATRNVYNKY